MNFAYSLVAGLLNGNANVVRVPSKDFPQVTILTDAFNAVLRETPEMQPYPGMCYNMRVKRTQWLMGKTP